MGEVKESQPKVKYLLCKKPDGIYLTVESDPDLLYPVTMQQLLADLATRRIAYEHSQIEACFKEAGGEEVKISANRDTTLYQTGLKLRVTPDQMKAYLLVQPFINGEQVTTADILKILKENNIAETLIKREQLERIVAKQDQYRECLIAEGIPSREGENAHLVFHFNRDGLEVKPQELDDGSVDFYNLNLIQTVQPGTVLVEKVPPTLGINGTSVYGTEIQAKPGKDIRLPIGANTQAIDGNSKLAATAAGHIVWSNKKVSVMATYEVKGDVDFTTGNIQYPGNVIIHGNVKNNFEVEASGDVEIYGNLEGTVRAGSNIQVKKGIVRGKAFACGSVYARYIENGTIESGASVIVTEAIMHSVLKAAKKVHVGGKKGLLVGGTCSAGEEIRAKNIGSSLGTATVLEVGIRPEIRQEYRELNKKIALREEELEKSLKVIKTLQIMKQKTGTLTPDKNELFLRFSRLQYQFRNELQEMNERKEELEYQFMYMNQAKISIENHIYSGIVMHMGKSTYSVVEEMDRVQFILEDVEIRIVPLKK